MEKIKIPETIVQRAANAAKALRAQAALPANESLRSRATFYSRRYGGGGYRTARKAFTCMQFGCFHRVESGETYFDTMEVTTWPATKRICACCAEEKV